MKQVYFLLIFFSSIVIAQAQEDAVQSSAIEAAQTELANAQEAYNKAQQELENAKAEKIAAENEVEKARMNVRTSTIAVQQAKKQTNPIVEDAYKVIGNPVYEEMSKGIQYGYSVFMPNVETSGMMGFLSRNVDNEFKSYMKNYKYSKAKRSKGELFFDNIEMANVSPTPIDLYADFKQEENGVTLRTYFNVGSQFINFSDDNMQAKNAKQIIDHFAKFIYKDNLEKTLTAQEKELEQQYKTLESSKQAITKAKETMNELEAGIVTSRQDIEDSQTKIDEINEKIERTRLKLSKVE